MAEKPGSGAPLNTFIVRFWQKPGEREANWHGQVQHVQSGERELLTHAEKLISFMEQWMALRDDSTDEAS